MENEQLLPGKLSAEMLSEMEKGKHLAREIHIDGIIGSFPIIGPFWSAMRSGLQMEKVIDRLEKLDRNLVALGVTTIPRSFFESDEGYDLLVNVCQNASRTNSEEKIEQFARIVHGVLNNREITIGQSESYIDIVNSISNEEFAVLTTISQINHMIENEVPAPNIPKRHRYNAGNDGDSDEVERVTGVTSNRHGFIVNRLEGKGLIESAGTDYNEGEYYQLTFIGQEFIEFICKP